MLLKQNGITPYRRSHRPVRQEITVLAKLADPRAHFHYPRGRAIVAFQLSDQPAAKFAAFDAKVAEDASLSALQPSP